MSENSPILSLPYIQDSQAQKHVTHNEGMRVLDAVTQLGVKSASLSEPPAASDGDRYLVAAGGTFDWASHDGEVAVWVDAGWQFFVPKAGWLAWTEDEGKLLAFDGTSWIEAGGAGGGHQNLAEVGINTTADATNRLASSAAATLLTHEGAGHQLKINKAADSDTASLLFQTNWSGRAEMGTAGSDDFAIKTSADGATFHTALSIDHGTGMVSFPSGANGLTQAEFGDGVLVTLDYASAKGTDLVANGTCLLGNACNYPSEGSFDGAITPNLPGAVSFAGYAPGTVSMEELLPVDPNQVYRISSYIRQEGLPGDFSAYGSGERHIQYMGLVCLDADDNVIDPQHHMRYRHGDVDSLTTLAAPLTPGDTVVSLTDASGWNESETSSTRLGMVIFGYKNSFGYKYADYSRIFGTGLFDVGDVNKTANTVTLNNPLDASMGNPDDPAGTWPVGTPIANADSGGNYKYAGYSGLVVNATDTWYRTENYIGGIDGSGRNMTNNFAPGTAKVRIVWLPNYSNHPGGAWGYPDTGANHRVWVAGVSVVAEPLAHLTTETTGAYSGSKTIRVPVPKPASGYVELAFGNFSITEL